MRRKELKARARQQLGGGIFKNSWMLALAACFIVGLILSAASSIGIAAIIVSGPLTYGLSAMFIKQARDGEPMKMANIFSGFQADFGGTLLIGLLTSVFTALWSLLLIVPGIIKAYAYSMAYAIKYDHPDYNWKQCIKASIALMKGNKWRLFMLDLSFIGWYIVGALVCGIGTLWVTPYHNAARAQFYNDLCGKAAPSEIPPCEF